MSVLVFFRKSYVKAHQRRLKSGQVITIPAHYDKRTKKGAESPLAHGHDLRHLDAAKRAVFEKMHAEQHLLHHYHAHALRQRVQEQQGHLEGLAKQVADHRAAGRHVEAAKTENQRLRLHSRHRVNQRELEDIEQRLAGLAGMKEALVQGSGAIDASTADSHKAYADKLGARFKAPAKPEPKPAAKPQEYRYALVNRPFGIGTAPKDGWVRTEPRPAAGEDHHGLARHGFAIYSRPLTDQETSNFELTPMVTVDEHAKRLVAKMGRYAAKYAEPQNAELLAEYVTQNARSVKVASTDDMATLQQRVLALIGGDKAKPFTPTHELSDGTPVVATDEKGVYTDASGAEIEDDYAQPIKAVAPKQQHEASKDGPSSPAESATTGTTGSQARDQAPAGGAVSFDALKGQYSAGTLAALDRRAQENHWPTGFVSQLSQGLASLPQEIRDYFDHQAAMGNDVLIKHIANLDEIPGEFRESYRNAAAMTVNGMRIEFIEDRFPSLNSLRHELVHYAWANLYGSDQRPGAGRAVVDEVLADVAADGEKILKWATSKATTKDGFEQIEADSLTKKLRRFTRDQKAGKDISSILKSSVELELMVGGYQSATKAVLPTADADGQYATVAVYMAIAKRLGVTMSGEFAKEEGVAYRCGEDEATAKKVFGSVAQANERRLIEKNEPKIHSVVPELGDLHYKVSKLQRGINFSADPEGSQQKQAEIRAIQEGPLKKLHAQYSDALRAYAAQHPGWYDTSGERPWLRQTKEEVAPKPAAPQPKPTAKAPQEGDTKSENGIDYVLKDGRWHRTTAEDDGLKPEQASPAVAAKDAALRTAINHLKEDAQQADIPKKEQQEDAALISKLEAAADLPVTPPTDDLDPSSPNYRYRDTGYVGGSRKELAAAMLRTAKRDGTQVRKNDIDWETLETNPREAKEVITKSHLFGTVDWEGLKAQGLTPGAGFVMDRVYASVGTGPRDDTPQARQDYALGLETLRNRLEVCRTPEDIEKTLAELKDERDGVNLNAEEAARFQELEKQAKAAYAPVHTYKQQEYQLDKAVGIAHRIFYAAESPSGHRRGSKYTPDQQADIDKARAGLEAAQHAKQAFVAAHPEMQEETVTVHTPKGTMTTWTRPAETEWRRLRQQQDVVVALATARNQVESPMLRAWSQLGERFNAVLDYRGRGSDTFHNHLATAKLGRIKDWSWQKTDQTGTKAPRQVTEEGKRFQLQVADSHERVGGRSVPVASTADLKERFGLREVQSGNWVLRDPVSAKFHTEQTAGALADLADILGITDQQVAMNGRVALAFGARGTGNAGGVAARAHYEPVQRVINLTKMGGGGCLAHEWLHGLDNLLLESQGGTAKAEDFLTEDPSLLPPGPLRNAFQGLRDALTTGQHRIKQRLIYTPEHYRLAQRNITRDHLPEAMREYGLPNAARLIKESRDASTALDKLDILYEPLIARGQRGAKKHLADWRNVALAYHGGQPEGGSLVVATGKPQSSFAMEAQKLDNGALGKYWSKPHELAARAFQSYVEDKLSSQGRRNDYLSAKADNKYYRQEGLAPFPEGEERTRINAAFDKLIATMQADNSLAKALAKTAKPRVLLVKSRGWWGPAHGGDHGVRAPHEDNDAGGGVGAEFAITVTRKGKEAKYEVASGFFQWLGVQPNPIWADLNRLQAKHPDQFVSPEAVHEHILSVLREPWVALPATDGRYTLLLTPLTRDEHQAAVIRFELLGHQYRVRSAHVMSESQAAGKILRVEEDVLRRRGRDSTVPASSGNHHISPQGPDAGLTLRPPAKLLNKSMADGAVFFKACARDWWNGLFRAAVASAMPSWVAVFPNGLAKSYVHGHYRKNPKTGEMVWIDSYSDKRTTRQGQTLFAHDLHRQDHFKQNLAEGRLREAMHSFHDLDHDAAHQLAGTLGLHSGAKHADKKELMHAVRAKVLQQQQAYQDQVKAQEAKAKNKGQGPVNKPAVKPETQPADKPVVTPSTPPNAELDMHAVMDSAEKHLGTESTFEIFDHLPQRTGDNPHWSTAEMYRAIMAVQKERKNSKHSIAKHALLAANGGSPLGIEAKKPDSNRHALILPDASNPGKYRYSAYDEHGFYTHATHDTADQALDEAIKEGFTEHAPGSLDRLSQTDTWAQGMARAAEAQAGWKASAKAPASPPEAPAAKTPGQSTPSPTQPDPEDQVLDINGAEVPYAWKLVDAEDLAPTSAKADNQFRDRTRAASDEQVASMAANLKFRLLSDSPLMDYGAPVLAQDGKTIIGGNGRSLAIRRAYGLGQADGYQQDLAKRAARFGIDPAAVAKMKAPVLVRVLQQDVDIKQAAIASNEGGGARMSALEQARVDGERLGDLSDFEADEEGNFNTRANLPFIRRFLGTMPVAQRSAFQAADGGLSQEGISRLRNAVLYRAYGDSDVLSRLVESADPAQRNVLSALTRAAPTVAQASADVKAGNLHDLDVSADIVAATTLLAQVRGDGKFGSVDEYLNQQNLFGDPLSDATKIILKHFDRNLRSSKAMAGFLTDYYAAVRQIGDPKQMGMFADATPDKPTLLRQTDAQRQNAPSPQAALF